MAGAPASAVEPMPQSSHPGGEPHHDRPGRSDSLRLPARMGRRRAHWDRVAMPALAARRPTATVAFAGAGAAAALHWLDTAFANPWDGESARHGAPAALVAVLFAAAAVLVWPRLPRGPRALTACVSGLILLVAGGLSAWAVGAGEPEGGAWSGLLLIPAGAAMLACAVASLRGGPPRGRGERWARRAGGALAVVLSLMWIVMPVGGAIYTTGKPRTAVPDAALGLPHRDVEFSSTDGLRRPAGTCRRAPARRSCSSTVAAGAGSARSSTRACSPATATASCSTTSAGAARARAHRTPSAGRGSATSRARWRG
jgi:hypothetical protein